jgi:hypothetical protein
VRKHITILLIACSLQLAAFQAFAQFPTGPGTAALRTYLTAHQPLFWVALSDETTALTTGVKLTLRVPAAMTVTAVRASLTTAQTSGNILTIDIHETSTTILSTKITIDNGETTSTTALAPAVISDSSLASDAELIFEIDQVGDGTAAGLKVIVYGY